MPKILVITPVKHIPGVQELLESAGDVEYYDNPTLNEVLGIIPKYNVIFTNPNKSNVFIGRDLIDAGKNLRAICTASTGLNHIDIQYAKSKGITVISLTTEIDVITKISSTAEHAFALMFAALRHIPQAFESVKSGEWDYTKYIGRQMDFLTVGVVGYGRLGTKFAAYARAFGCKVLVYDPYKTVERTDIYQVGLDQLLQDSDIISLHVHVTTETKNMVNSSWFSIVKPTVILVNTSRGDVIVEKDAINFLRTHPDSCLAVDVIADEVQSKKQNLFIDYSKKQDNLIITPHIGGMTVEGQMIAYSHAAKLLKNFLEKGD
ncbi:MAG: NAD(P)-dependent oxidoreductase [Methanoregula sp.]